jgi:hypothetical protein
LSAFYFESDVFGLAKWLVPAPSGLFRAGAWIWLASPAHARPNGLQAILLAWQATWPAWHQPKNESGLRVPHIIWAPGILLFVVDTLEKVSYSSLGTDSCWKAQSMFIKSDGSGGQPMWGKQENTYSDEI